MKCDVLVVGAGPAGSSAARAAALAGADVILIEKMAQPGKIACGEAITSMFFPLLPFNIPKEQLKWQLDGMVFYTEDMYIERTGRLWKTYSIERKNFDVWLANEAVRAGAKLLTNTSLIGLDHENFVVERAIVETKNGQIEIEPKKIIAADGFESKLLKLLGLYKPKRGDIAEVYSWEMSDVKLAKPNIEQIYLGDYCDGGYAYIFPKSKNSANVGLGSIKGLNVKKRFDEFLELPIVRKQLNGCKKIIERSGKAPVRPFLDKVLYGNVLIVGDAACQNFKPFVEGIIPAIICGDLAGEAAAKNDSSVYSEYVRKKLGFAFEESNEIMKLLYEIFNMKDRKKYLLLLALATSMLSHEKIQQMFGWKFSDIEKTIREKSFFWKSVQENIIYAIIKMKGLMV
ncbi:MAG: NAD(P)/FAD-dependent oxidoreductase [Candidatus Aenigmatarchaeota archaeon]